MSLIARLPQYYRSNPAFLQIAQHVFPSPCRYSGLFVSHNGSPHLLLKDGSIHVQLDWEAYSLLRASARLILVSGEIVRKEPGVFKAREDYENGNIRDLYAALLPRERQKVFFFTRKLSYEQLRGEVDEQLYEVAQLPRFGSVHEAFSLLMAESTNLPVTVEFGLDLLHQYFEGVRKSGLNHIDTLLISKFTGNIDPKYVGPRLTVPLGEFYEQVWQSDPLPCEMSNGTKGVLSLEVHRVRS